MVISMSNDLELINSYYPFQELGQESGTKFLLSYASWVKHFLEQELRKLLLKVLEIEEVYVDVRAII